MLNNVGDCYFHLKKYDSALITYKQALEMGRSRNFGVATNTRNIGNVYEALGDLDLALECYVQAMRLSDAQVDYRGMTQSRESIASILFKRKQHMLAENSLNECLDIAHKAHLKAIIRDSYELLSKITSAQGRVAQSFEYFKLFTAYKDSIQNLSESSKIASLQLEYETHSKQLEIDALKRSSEQKAKELNLKNLLLISAIVGISVISLLLFSSIRNYRNKKLQHLEVLELNEKIREHEEELIVQRDTLVERNNKIESLHKQVSEINEGLENIVALRTTALKEQNTYLEKYAFITSHELRAPVARILGIINLMEKDISPSEQKLLFEHLKKSSAELDSIIHTISRTLQHGMIAYDQQDHESDRKA
jgi:tetratricopeptide (TPR) repeat protein